MAKLQWFPFFPSDFLGSTKVALMTTEQIGAYFLLLCHAWNDPLCSLPSNENVLAALAKLTQERWEDLRYTVMTAFEPHPRKPDRLHNPRLSEIRKKQEHAFERYIQGGRNRWKNGGTLKAPSSQPQGTHEHPEPEPEPDSPKKGRGAPALQIEETIQIEDLGPEQEFQGTAAQLAVAWLRGLGCKLKRANAQRIIQEAIDAGVAVPAIRTAFKAKEVKGKKLWDVLDPLREALRRTEDGRRFESIPTVCRNCGGTARVGENPCPGCPEGRALRRAQA